MPSLTKHGTRRGKERLSLNSSALLHLSAQILAKGLPPTAFKGQFKRYLQGHEQKNHGTVRVYGEQFYVFSGPGQDATLVTVMQAPPYYRALLRRMRLHKTLT